MITVCLHGGLREYGRRFDLHAANPAEAVRALLTQLPGFREILGSGFYQVRFNGHDFCEAELEHEFRQPESGILHIVPRIQGAGKAGQIIAGVVLIAFAWWNPFGWAAAGALMSAGIGLVAGGIAQMLARPPKLDNEQRGQKAGRNTAFSNLDNPRSRLRGFFYLEKTMADVATLGIGVDLSELRAATRELEKLEQSAAKTEKATSKIGGLGNQAAGAGNKAASYGRQYDAIQRIKEERGEDWLGGIRDGVNKYAKSMGTLREQMADMVGNTFDTLGNTLGDFVATGKANFRDMTVSILQDLSKIFIRMATMRLVSRFAGGSGMFANGGAFDDGLQFFASGGGFTNQVVSRPTMFAHGGGFGVMGEAGPEAIMPLTRAPNGKLGVAAQGGSGVQNNVNISVSISQTGNAESDSKADSEQGRRIARMLDGKIIEVLARESRPGGMLSNRQ